MQDLFSSKLRVFTSVSAQHSNKKTDQALQKLYKSKVEDILNNQIAQSASAVQYSKYVLNQARKMQETRQLLNKYSLESRIFIPKSLEKTVQQLQSKIVNELIEQKEKEYLLLLLKKYDPQLVHTSGFADQLIAEASQCNLIDMNDYQVQNDMLKSMNPENKQLKTSQWVLDYLDEAKYRYKDMKNKKGHQKTSHYDRDQYKNKSYQDKLQIELKNNFELVLEKRELEKQTAELLIDMEDQDAKVEELRRALREEQRRGQQMVDEKARIEHLARELVSQMKTAAL